MQTLGPKFQLRRIEAWRLAKVLSIAHWAYAHATSMINTAWDAPKKLVKLEGSWRTLCAG